MQSTNQFTTSSLIELIRKLINFETVAIRHPRNLSQPYELPLLSFGERDQKKLESNIQPLEEKKTKTYQQIPNLNTRWKTSPYYKGCEAFSKFTSSQAK